MVLLAVPLLLTGCGSESTPSGPTPSGSTAGADAADPRSQIAGFAALAQDRGLTAFYTLTVPGQPDRTVGVTRATDRSWRVDIPGGALGGTIDISIAQNADGIYQCALPSDMNHVDPVCVRVGEPGSTLPTRIDPRVQHAFADWQEVLTDRQAPLSVSTAEAPLGLEGSCFSVESTSASIAPALEPGIYCYDGSGTPTGAKLDFGTLALSGPPAAGPPTISLPAPVVDREPLEVGGPAAPSDAPSTRTVG
ncbi:hypothetical protein SAMN05444365_101791 [Micromonospora pattaloongensis]|uniref:Lipoprotein n=2 Tax=Micromonospora pattaloongensis TaxID=405436 RepID=A0A1H3HE39_9ACTN|nr:hypothetical protein SAMN05444365_101791 [Micromonospora pattaloongensis]